MREGSDYLLLFLVALSARGLAGKLQRVAWWQHFAEELELINAEQEFEHRFAL